MQCLGQVPVYRSGYGVTRVHKPEVLGSCKGSMRGLKGSYKLSNLVALRRYVRV